MTINEIRERYFKFFQSKQHALIPAAPLVLEGDATTLFTSSGMQPLVPYLMGQPHPQGKRLVDSQPSIRVQDIEEVGDNRHTTFFEMLGNWSLGDYFKKEQLGFVWEFLTDPDHGLGLPKEKLYVSLFKGDESIPFDSESEKYWLELGVSEDHIFSYDAKKNWWSRSGTPDQMPVGEIGGTDSEIFFEFDQIPHNSAFGEKCHPNCDCGRYMEIGNSVFMQYQKVADGSLVEMSQKNVDFGGGLERMAAATNNDPDVFKIDVFKKIISSLENTTGKNYEDSSNQKNLRIISDHLRAAVFLLSYGVLPSNKAQGYVLRRLIRRSVVKMREIMGVTPEPDVFKSALLVVESEYKKQYFSDLSESFSVNPVSDEVLKFSKTLERGMKEFAKMDRVDGEKAFDMYQTYGFPLEITIELMQQRGEDLNIEDFKSAFVKHQESSRTASAGSFKGGLADSSQSTTALHTVTHLLHAALFKVLGDKVMQKGSNITSERLRFDFAADQKLTDDQVALVEEFVNQAIEKKLRVVRMEMEKQKAMDMGAKAFFGQKYPDIVSVYQIGEADHVVSLEICGGPHVESLSEIHGHVKIVKQEALGNGVRRVYAKILPFGS